MFSSGTAEVSDPTRRRLDRWRLPGFAVLAFRSAEFRHVFVQATDGLAYVVGVFRHQELAFPVARVQGFRLHEQGMANPRQRIAAQCMYLCVEGVLGGKAEQG